MIKKLISLSLVCTLCACNLDSLSSSEKITYLEETGALPTLDRSDDLAGPDENNNGVRDDIEAYIEKEYSDPQQRAAAMQIARAAQKSVLVDVNDKDAVRQVVREKSRAINCTFTVFNHAEDDKNPAIVSREIHDMTKNTKSRLLAYMEYNSALDGMSWSLPEGDTCE